MANETNKTTEILEFQVDQGKGITDLEKMRKTLIGLKEEQKALNDAYKKGNITQEEYVKEITRVDTVLKKVSTTHSSLQKNLTGVQSQTDKLIKSNRDLAKTFKDSANDISVAGVGLGTLTSRVSSLLNPIGATVAIVGALGAAYARSTIGAKDLAFASSQLSAATTILTNDFASLISSAEDGEGFVTKAFNQLLYSLGPAGANLAEQSKSVALAQEALEDLLREEIKIRGQVSDRLSDNQELLTEINDSQTTYQDKLLKISDIVGNLRTNQKELVSIQEQELGTLQRKLAGDQENEDLQTAVLDKERDIAKIKSDTEKKIQAILRLEDNVKQQNEAQQKAEVEKTKQKQLQTSELERQARIATLERQQKSDNRTEIQKFQDDNQLKVDSVQLTTKQIGDAQEAFANRVERLDEKQKKSNDELKASQDARVEAIRHFTSVAASLYQANDQSSRKFAALQLAIDAALTLSGITRAAAALPAKQQAIYKAAAILSAGASLAQAAKILGTNGAGNITGTGPGGSITPQDRAEAEAEAKKAGNQQLLGSTLTGVSIGASIGSIIPGIGTAIGAVVGGVVGLVSGLFKRRKTIKNATDGFAHGGWTGPGDTSDVAGIVHADEYVTPKRVVNSAAAQPHINALERMRLRGYAEGGYVSGPSGDLSGLVEAFKGMEFYVAVTEINKGQSRLAKKVTIANR